MVETDKVIDNSCEDEVVTKQRSHVQRNISEKENNNLPAQTELKKSQVIFLFLHLCFKTCVSVANINFKTFFFSPRGHTIANRCIMDTRRFGLEKYSLLCVLTFGLILWIILNIYRTM